MNIALIGYGKMGKLINELAPFYSLKIVKIIDVDNKEEIKDLNKFPVDVAVEFTEPTQATQNIIECFKQNIPVVCGTTGWYDELNIVKEACSKYKGALVYSPNFSISILLLKKIVNFFLDSLNVFPEKFNFSISETHHLQKKDYPSGTAISFAQIILNKNYKEYKTYKAFLNPENEMVQQNETILPIFSYRKENLIGTHLIKAYNDNEEIIFTHIAKNRKIFIEGIVLSIFFIVKNKGIYTFEEVVNRLYNF